MQLKAAHPSEGLQKLLDEYYQLCEVPQGVLAAVAHVQAGQGCELLLACCGVQVLLLLQLTAHQAPASRILNESEKLHAYMNACVDGVSMMIPSALCLHATSIQCDVRTFHRDRCFSTFIHTSVLYHDDKRWTNQYTASEDCSDLPAADCKATAHCNVTVTTFNFHHGKHCKGQACRIAFPQLVTCVTVALLPFFGCCCAAACCTDPTAAVVITPALLLVLAAACDWGSLPSCSGMLGGADAAA